MDWLLLLLFAKAFCIGYGVLYAFAATVHTGRPLVITKKSLVVAFVSGNAIASTLRGSGKAPASGMSVKTTASSA